MRPEGIVLPAKAVRAPALVTVAGSNTWVVNSLKSPARIFSVGTV